MSTTASKTDEMLELLASGQGQLDNPLILIISTAGLDLNVPMHTVEYQYASRILDEEIEDDSYFCVYCRTRTRKVDLWMKSRKERELDKIKSDSRG